MQESRSFPAISPFWGPLRLGLLFVLLPVLVQAADFSGWERKMEITFGGFGASVSETSFPALVKLSEGTPGFDYEHFESTTGGDLRFSASDGTTELNYEIDEWDTNGTSLVWVSVPLLTNGVTIYAYWRNASQATPPTHSTDGSTWTNGHAGVWHLDEDGAAVRLDSTPNGNDSGSLVSDPIAATGKIGSGNDFDGNDALSVPDSTSLGDDTVDSMSVSTWMKSDVNLSTEGATYRCLEKGDCYFLLQGQPGGTLGSGGQNFLTKSAGGGGLEPTSLGQALNAGQWYHITGTFDGTDTRLYLDGVLKDTHNVGANIDDDNLALRIGSDDSGKWFNGVLDEVRVSSVWRSTDWVRAAYLTSASNDAVTAYQVVLGPPTIENLPPTGLSANAGTLRADLVSTGGQDSTVWVYYGDEDGEDVAGAWDTNVLVGTGMPTGVVTKSVSDLVESGIHYFRFFASNTLGTSWSPASTRFRTTTDFSAWGSRVSISFTNCINASPLGLFPVLVELDETIPGFSYDQFGSTNGADLRFSEADGATELDYEIDLWNTGGTSTVWVQVPVLTNNTQIWAYWNNAWASPGETGRTWSEGFLGVYHLQEDSSDSTASGNHGTDNGVVGPAGGLVGGGYSFTPNADVNLGSGARWETIDNENTFTLSGWINPNILTADLALIGRWGGVGAKQCLLWLDVGNNKTNFVSIVELPSLKTSESTGIDAVLGQWQYVSAVADGNTLSVYVNGIFSASNGSGYDLAAVPTRNIYLGSSGNNDKYLNGSLDEARIACMPRSREWIRTEYLNMASNDHFNTVGTVESAPFVSSLPATGIAGLSATMRGNLASTGTAETAVWVYYGKSDGTNNPTAWDTYAYFGAVSSEGAVSTNITGLDHETTYYYRFYASNSVGDTWAHTTESFDTLTDFARWQEKVEITFTNLAGRIPLTNFPVLVRLGTSVPGFTYCRFESDQGHDLRFSAADQATPLNYEVEAWDPDGESTVWVRVPVLTNNASIWAFWGSAADTGSASPHHGSGVWSEEYLGVYHLHAGADDSTANANDGVEEAGPVKNPGVVGDALDFAGGARVDLGTNEWSAINAQDTFTLGTWINPDVINDDLTLFGKFSGTAEQLIVWLDGKDGGDGLLNYVVYDPGGSAPRTPMDSGIPAKQDTWQYVVATSDGDVLRIYVDGQLSGTSASGVNLGPTALHLSLGTDNGDKATRVLDGSLDEARVTYVTRPLDWIWAEYMNMASNGVFNTYGDVQYGSPAAPIIANLAPTGTTYESAWLRADLVSTGTAETTVWVYYGNEDGSNNPTAWDTGVNLNVQSPEGIVVSTEITGLDAFSGYFYRFYASNSVGTAWTDETQPFGTALRMGQWTHRVDIEVPYDRSTPLTNFPVLVVLGTNIIGFSYDDVAYADGTDLRFTPTDGRSLLNYEIEEWNTNGNSYVWVQMPTLVSGSYIHAYWGNPSAMAYASTTNGATWDETFRAVWHLDQIGTASDVTDATTNNCDGTNLGSANIDGFISKAQDFETGTTDDINLATTPSSTFLPVANSPISISSWVKAESIDSGDAANRIMTIHRGDPSSAIALGLGKSDRVDMYHSDGSGAYLTSVSTVTSGEWIHVTATYDGSTYRVYLNGAFEISDTDGLSPGSTRTVRIGSYEGTGRHFDGIIDEVRVSSVARSEDWVHACYMNQRSNTVFDAYGTVRGNFDAELPVIETSVATDIVALSATMNGSLTSTGSSATAVALYWGAVDEQAGALAWDHTGAFSGTHAPGALSSNITGLSETTTYYYRYRASNAAGIRWSTTASFTTYPLPDVDNAGGADVAVGSALLNGNLVASNGAPCGALIYWGPSDGGSSTAAWANTNDIGSVAVGAFQSATHVPVSSWSDFTSVNVGNGTGGADYTSGAWTVTGSGTRIWDPGDHFHYACRQVRGDFDVYCRAGDITGATHDYRKAGLMARDGLSTTDRYAFTMRTPTGTTHQVRIQWRTTPGGSSGNQAYTDATNAYYWIRLTRVGDTFASYWAEDTGSVPSSWTQVGTSKTIPMNDQVYLGLAVCSYSTVDSSTVIYDGWGGRGAEGNLLTYGQQYYYRCSATNHNGRGWAESTTNFLTSQPDWVGITNTMASGLTTTSATFRAVLDAEHATFDVYAYWGLTNEGTNPGAWAHGNYVGTYTNVADLDVSVTDNGMTADTLYHYTFQATNIEGDVWADPSGSYRTVGAPTVTNASPLDYTNGTATVGGVLTYGGNAYATVYWGLIDEGQNAAAWGNTTTVGQVIMGVFRTNITVGAGGTYYYRVYVTNDVDHA